MKLRSKKFNTELITKTNIYSDREQQQHIEQQRPQESIWVKVHCVTIPYKGVGSTTPY